MGKKAQAQELRDLLSLAKKLRDYAAQSDDAHYVALFLTAAETVEARASTLGFTSPPAQDAPQYQPPKA